MLMADDRSNLWPSSDELPLDDDDPCGNLSIDIETLMDILEESPVAAKVKFLKPL